MTALAEALARLRLMTPARRSAVLELVTGGDRNSIDRIETALEIESADDDSFLSPGGPLAGAFGARLVAAVEDAERERDLVGRRIGSVRVERELGGGGFGRVYLGRDEKLDRPIAVKALRATQRLRAEARERFEREARLLSRLDHPNICRIYGLAEEEDADYLLLEYVDGERLTDAARGADFSTRLGLLRQIALALAAAHEAGIIHRDLKPDNILVTAGGTVKVLDLGIARIEGELEAAAGPDSSTPEDPAPGLTRRGSRLGTVLYMSPEQARGEPVTTASDLFALGLLGHELFAGGPAYRQADRDRLMERVQRGAVAAFSHSDEDLSRLVADLLRPAPFGRPTAAETVERLEAVLDRPRRERRRRLRWLAVGVGAAALVAILAAWWTLRAQAARDLATAAEVLTEVKDIEWRMRAEHLSPAHDLTAARAEVRERLEALALRVEELGPRARGRGRYALGRAALSLGDLARARKEVEAAWEDGHQTPEAAYTLGRILADTLRNEIEWAQWRSKPEEFEREAAHQRVALGVPAVGYLELAREARIGPPGYVEALLAVSELDYRRALEAIETVELPWFHEAHELAGWVQLRMAWQEADGGTPEGLANRLSSAEAAYSRAIEVGRSAPGGAIGLCHLSAYQITRGRLSAEEALARGEAAVDTCRQALAIDPGSIDARWGLIDVLYAQAEVAGNQGRDGRRFLDDAIAIAEEGLLLEPHSVLLQSSLLSVLSLKASGERLNGIDPEATYARGREVADRLVAAENVVAAQLNGAVLLLLDNGYYWTSQGKSPVAVLGRAIQIAERILEIDPDNIFRANLAGCYYVLALYQAEHGIDPTEAIRRGVTTVEESLATLSGQLIPLRILGLLKDLAHNHARRIGGDVETPLAGSRLAYEEALTIDPDFVWARLGLVDLELSRVEWLIERERSPETELERVEELLDHLVDAEDFVESTRLLWSGRAAYLEGRWRAIRGESPLPLYDRAERLLRRGISMRDNEPELFNGLAEVLYLRAEWLGRGSGALDLVARGLAVTDRVIAAASDNALAFELRARLSDLEAELTTGARRETAVAKALRAQQRACEINRFLPLCGDDVSSPQLPGSAT